MPLDKARIQGFGSDCPPPPPATDSGLLAPQPQASFCPAGHALQLWSARAGWCDGCGNKIQKGEDVMDCRACNYYLCQRCHPVDGVRVAPQNSSFWEAISSLTDQMSSPAVQSALDNVALRLGDVIDAATQDVTDIATELKSYVTSSIGLQEDDGSAADVAELRNPIEEVSPRQRVVSMQIVAEFSERYPAARVAPNKQELDSFWTKCSSLHPGPVSSAIHDQLSFASGDYAWQPRLRILCALLYLFKKGGVGKDIAFTVASQAANVIHHLMEVPQCKDKASEVMLFASGKSPALEASEQRPDAQATSEKALETVNLGATSAVVDLLDIAGPAATTSCSSAPSSSPKTGPHPCEDLLSGGSAASSLLGQDLISFDQPTSATPSATKTLFCVDAGASHQGAMSNDRWLIDANNQAPCPAMATRPNVPQPTAQIVHSIQPLSRAAAPPVRLLPDLSPTSRLQDPFAFVAQHTGIGDLPTRA